MESFEFNLTVPADVRFAGMVCHLAVHGARHAGHADAEASAFGLTVEEAVLGMLAAAHPEADRLRDRAGGERIPGSRDRQRPRDTDAHARHIAA